MTCLKIYMLISDLLHLILQRCNVSFERFRSSTEVRHGTHDSGCLDGHSGCSLITVAQKIFIPALDVSIDCDKLSK